ncbi:MAG: hypothetical protein ACKVP5_11635 [Aestuariivirga sp.]
MSLEERLREKLRKIEALFMGGATSGERSAAGAAAERLKAKLAEATLKDPAVELAFTMPDPWSVKLFLALCRRYGFKPFRYPRQRRTTVMVKAPRRAFEEVVWRQFLELHEEMQSYFEETTEKLIRDSVHADSSDAETVAEPPAIR